MGYRASRSACWGWSRSRGCAAARCSDFPSILAAVEIAVGLCVVIGFLLAGGLLFIALVIGVVMAARGRSVKSPFSGQGIRSWINRGNLLASGTPARAILLSVASTGTRTSFYGQRCEIRNAYVDIELPGVPHTWQMREPLQMVLKELAALKEQRTRMAAQWQHEKDSIQGVRTQREELEKLRQEVENRGLREREVK